MAEIDWPAVAQRLIREGRAKGLERDWKVAAGTLQRVADERLYPSDVLQDKLRPFSHSMPSRANGNGHAPPPAEPRAPKREAAASTSDDADVDEPSPSDWPARIRAIQTARGWGNDTLADAIGVSVASVSLWRAGKAQPTGARRDRLAALERGGTPASDAGRTTRRSPRASAVAKRPAPAPAPAPERNGAGGSVDGDDHGDAVPLPPMVPEVALPATLPTVAVTGDSERTLLLRRIALNSGRMVSMQRELDACERELQADIRAAGLGGPA